MKFLFNPIQLKSPLQCLPYPVNLFFLIMQEKAIYKTGPCLQFPVWILYFKAIAMFLHESLAKAGACNELLWNSSINDSSCPLTSYKTCSSEDRFPQPSFYVFVPLMQKERQQAIVHLRYTDFHWIPVLFSMHRHVYPKSVLVSQHFESKFGIIHEEKLGGRNPFCW